MRWSRGAGAPRLLLPLLVAAFAHADAADATSASLPLLQGEYRVGNHPGGNQAPPYYGLRLDGLDGDPGHVFSFDVGHCSPHAESLGCSVSSDLPANVGLTAFFDGSGFSITGTVFGGRSNDDAFQDPIRWAVDFTYSELLHDAAENLMFADEGTGSGSITALDSGGGFAAGEAFVLGDKAGENPYSFALLFDHRGMGDRLSGVGWITVDGDGANFKDWLFTLEELNVVPEPGTFLLTALGLALFAAPRARPGPGGRVQNR